MSLITLDLVNILIGGVTFGLLQVIIEKLRERKIRRAFERLRRLEEE